MPPSLVIAQGLVGGALSLRCALLTPASISLLECSALAGPGGSGVVGEAWKVLSGVSGGDWDKQLLCLNPVPNFLPGKFWTVSRLLKVSVSSPAKRG